MRILLHSYTDTCPLEFDLAKKFLVKGDLFLILVLSEGRVLLTISSNIQDLVRSRRISENSGKGTGSSGRHVFWGMWDTLTGEEKSVFSGCNGGWVGARKTAKRDRNALFDHPGNPGEPEKVRGKASNTLAGNS